MNKTKVSPQDLTLLDEFEQDTDIVIRILENSLKKIDKWHEDLGKTDLRFIAQRTRNDVIKILESFAPFGDAYPQILRFLTIRIPEFKGRIEEKDSNIKAKIREIVHKYGQDPLSVLTDQAKSWVGDLYVDMCELKSYTENLNKDLSYCVKIAKEQTEKIGGEVKIPEDYNNKNIEKDLLGANPVKIYNALYNRPPMLMTEGIRHKLDMGSNAGNLKRSGKSIYEVIQQDIQSFQRRAIKEANNDDKLIQKIENYVDSLCDWLQDYEKENTLSNTKKIQLNIQRHAIIDELLEKKKNKHRKKPDGIKKLKANHKNKGRNILLIETIKKPSSQHKRQKKSSKGVLKMDTGKFGPYIHSKRAKSVLSMQQAAGRNTALRSLSHKSKKLI